MGMDNDKDNGTASPAELRRLAEERLQAKMAGLQLPRTDETTMRLVHELEVHQIELEMQNAELRQARDEVELALERYTDLYDFAPVGYFTLDREGVVSAVNLTGASLVGIERSRLIGRSFRGFLSVTSREIFSQCLAKVFAQQGKESCEISLTTAGPQPLLVQMEALADASGKECRIALIDISERRRAEAELGEKKRELEEINRSLNVRIAAATENLRQKDQMLILQDRQAVMGEMINNIAHQWKQPLNSLGLVVQELPLCYDSGQFSRELLVANTATAMKLIQHMSQTIEDFRNLFKVDKEAVTFGVNEVITRTVSLIHKSFADQNVEIALHSEGNPMATGFPNEYSQVLLNILLNARDALVGTHVEDARITISASEEGGRSVVTITDNAGGIPDEIMDKIFEAYFTTKGPDKGTGIGLFMSKAIIEKSMSGRLTVRNTGKGAEFRIQV